MYLYQAMGLRLDLKMVQKWIFDWQVESASGTTKYDIYLSWKNHYYYYNNNDNDDNNNSKKNKKINF